MSDQQENVAAAPEVAVDKSAEVLAGFEEGAEVHTAGAAPGKKRRLGFGLIMLVVVASVIGILVYWSGSGEANVKAKGKAKPEAQVANPNAVMESAVASMRDSVVSPAIPRPSSQKSVVENQAAGASQKASSPVTIQPGLAGTVASEGGKVAGVNPGPGVVNSGLTEQPPANLYPLRPAAGQASQRNGERSVRFTAPPAEPKKKPGEGEEGRAPAAASPVVEAGPKPSPVVHRESAPALDSSSKPEFGSMIPIQTMGVVYTLQGGSLVRMSVLRDVKGRGWVLKRGTVVVGRVQSGQLDRAYVELLGYLSQETGNLVRLGGQALGSDGGAGLKGRQRKVSRQWGRILDRVAQTSIQALTSILNRNKETVIYGNPTDIYRAAGLFDNRRDSPKEFVEVAAGTVGFVMVTDLPPVESHLAGARPILASAEPSGGLSDSELARILQSEDPAGALREALPRMSEEARRVLEQVIREIESGLPQSGKIGGER